MKEGDVSEPIRTPQGYAFITVLGKQDPYLPKLDEVKAKVKDDVIKERAVDVARQKAAAIDAALKSGDFEKTAKDAGLEVKTTDLIARGAPIVDVGVSPAHRCGGIFAAAGRRQRPDRHRHRRGGREGAREEGNDAS